VIHFDAIYTVDQVQRSRL